MYPHKNGTSVPGPQSRETCQISGFTQSNTKLPAGPPLAFAGISLGLLAQNQADRVSLMSLRTDGD